MSEDHERRSKRFREAFDQLRSEMGKILVGQEEIIRGVLAAFFVEGHVLLEGAQDLGRPPSCAHWPRPQGYDSLEFNLRPT